MTALERNTAPPLKKIERIEFLRAEKKVLKNGIPVYLINAGNEEVLRIEMVFVSGNSAGENGNQTYPEKNPLLASTVNHLISEGTSRHSSSEIAESFDFFGSFIQTDCDKDTASVSLFTLNKYVKNTLPLLEEIIKDAIFPEKEITTYLANTRQKFIVDSEKVHVISRRKFNEVIFGKEHPYGNNVELKDFENIKRGDLIDFFKNFYSPHNCKIILSGKINEGVFDLLENHFGNWDGVETRHALSLRPPNLIKPDEKKIHFVERKNQVQTAIRIGRPLFSKKHPDYPAMKVLNVVLGGYFGSRLMTNIREEKGYTYGVGSAVFPLKQAGCFFISTEVGSEVTREALKEIYFEIARLREEEVSEEELQKVRNYMLGEIIRSIDGPFALAERLKGLLIFGLDYDNFDQLVETIKNTSPKRIMELAQKYLKQEDLFEIVVGSMGK